MSKERIFIFLGIVVLAFLAYRNCLHVFIPSDNYTLLYFFDKGTVMDFQKEKLNFSPYFFSFPVVYVLYKLFGISSVCWVSTSILLHAVNAFLVYLIAERILKKLILKNIKSIAFFSALLFLISPYQTEAILWSPCEIPTTLLVTALTLLCLWMLLKYFELPKKVTLFFAHLFFLLAVFSHESAFILPAIVFVLFLVYKKTGSTELSIVQIFNRILFPQAVILFMYMIASKILFGGWLWHGGNLQIRFSFYSLSGTALKYIAKFLLLYRYLPLQSVDEMMRNIFNKPTVIIIFFLLIFLLIAMGFSLLTRKNKRTGLLLLAFFSCFLISLLPVLPLDSSFMKYIYPDRYGYLPSVFFYIFFTSSIVFLFKKIAIPFLAGYAFLCWLLLMQTISVWTETNAYCTRLAENYKPFLKYDKVYVLDLPAYYKGISAFRCGFPETIFFNYNLPPEKISVITGSYYEHPADSITSACILEKRIEVKGNLRSTPYFSTRGGWAKSYQTEECIVNFDSMGCAMLSYLKKIFRQIRHSFTLRAPAGKKLTDFTIF